MKKIVLLLASYVLCLESVFSQEIEWQNTYGGGGLDRAQSIVKTTDGGYLVAGYADDDGLDITCFIDQSTENGGWIIKLDSLGNLLWQSCINGVSWTDVKQTPDNGFILTGDEYSWPDFESDGVIHKIDSFGNLEWQYSYGFSGGEDKFNSVEIANDGGYVFTGISSTDILIGNIGGEDLLILKLDSAGNFQWEKIMGGTSNEFSSCILKTQDGGFIIAGTTGSNDSMVTGYHGGGDEWIVKVDSSGNLEWQKTLGGTLSEWSSSVKQLNDGSYIIEGYSKSSDGDVSANNGNYDIWIVKLDSIGNLIWENSFGGSLEEYSRDIILKPNGNIVIGGYTSSSDVDVSFNHGSRDVWIVEADSLGSLLKEKTFGGSGTDLLFSMELLTSQDFISCGSSGSNNGDVYPGSPTYYNWITDFWIIEFTEHYNKITGKLFIDSNSNSVQDAGELAVSNKMITEINTSRFAFSQQNGNYSLSVLDSGNFATYPAPINYYNTTPATHTSYFSGIQLIDSLNDFAFQPAGVFNDLCVAITPLSAFRAGFNASYMINYENVGTTTLSPTVIFFPDNDITFVSANPVASSVTLDSVVWNFGPLAPFQTGSILVTVNVNAGILNGTLISSSVEIDPVVGDANTLCNYDISIVYSVGSADPNAILVDEDTVFTTQLTNPPYLEYIIYFQNTGNDTVFNTRVLNNLPQELDLATFEFVASSHPMNITYDAHARLMTFTFDNILLPDSIVNEPASHGFVRYRIKPKTNLVAGNKIYNKAFIYFDINQPVQTNTAVTEIVLPTGMSEFNVQSSTFTVYPNPAGDGITIQVAGLENGLSQEFGVKLFDLYGREVFSKYQVSSIKTKEIKLDISKFAKGIYFVQLKTSQNIYSAKFVKQ